MEELPQEYSAMDPIALTALIVMMILTWTLPRRYAACPLLTMTCLMPLGQSLVLFDVNFQLFRILLLTGAIRVIFKGESAELRRTTLDKVFIAWLFVSVVFGSLSNPSGTLLISRLGDAYNALGCYFFFRCIIVDMEDFVTSVLALAVLSIVVASLMLIEKTTGNNLLSVFGGVPAVTIMRDGHLRCQGAFRHPILAGVFGAVNLPFFIMLWRYESRYRRLAITAALASVVIVVTSSSSGALMGVVAAATGLFLWRWRTSMRKIRWLSVAIIIFFAIIMKAPVWYLLARLGDVTGGGGWHRAWLIDQAVTHIDEWWLFGTTYTAHWAPADEVIPANPNMMDITNHYVMEGVKGGALKLALFLTIIVQCFKAIGRTLKTDIMEPKVLFLIWAAGVSLFVHCVSFISLTYFDQSIVIWYWLLGSISGLCYYDTLEKTEKEA